MSKVSKGAHVKILLDEKELPRQWYNIQADMPSLPKPPLNPVTKQPVGPADLSAIFPMELIKQEVTTKRWVDIPEVKGIKKTDESYIKQTN